MSDLTLAKKSLERECSSLRKRLAEEHEEKAALEEQVHRQLEDIGEDVAQEAVAAFEAKYNRLKTRYRVRLVQLQNMYVAMQGCHDRSCRKQL